MTRRRRIESKGKQPERRLRQLFAARRVQAAELLLSAGRIPLPREDGSGHGPGDLGAEVLAPQHPSVQALGLVRRDHSELALESRVQKAEGPTTLIGESRPMQDVHRFLAMVAPTVARLAHESCSITGEMLISIAGRVARAVVAETPGVYRPSWTIEEVFEQMPAIRNTDSLKLFQAVPSGHIDHIGYSFAMAKKGAAV